MKISGRNKLPGTVTRVKRGAVNGEVEIDIGNGNTIAGVITLASVDDMGIREGDKIIALIKASSVMFMKE